MVSEELKAVRDTLTYMKENLPYYKDVLASVDVTTFQLEDMTTLPLTTKDDLKKDPKSFIAHKLTPEYVAWTGGTTGNAIPVYMAREEFAEMYNTPPGRKKRFLGIQVHNTDHGLPLKTPTDVFWLDHFLDTLVQNRNLENIITDLTTTHCIPGVDELPRIISFTSQENLKALTLELLRRGITDTPVKFIFGTGDYISPYWVHLVEKVFGGKYIDCYANTETTTVAVVCGQCGYFHVNPTVFTEVVDTKTLEPVTEGSGFFVVTTLYPYRKMQLLLRYNTEDIVEIKECSQGFAFELKGRSEELFRVRETYVTFKTFLDIVDDIPDIWMREPYCYKPIRVEWSPKTNSITLRCYLYYAPGMYPQRVAQITQTIVDRFFDVYPELNSITLTVDFAEMLHTLYTWPQPMKSSSAFQQVVTERNTPAFEEGLFIT